MSIHAKVEIDILRSVYRPREFVMRRIPDIARHSRKNERPYRPLASSSARTVLADAGRAYSSIVKDPRDSRRAMQSQFCVDFDDRQVGVAPVVLPVDVEDGFDGIARVDRDRLGQLNAVPRFVGRAGAQGSVRPNRVVQLDNTRPILQRRGSCVTHGTLGMADRCTSTAIDQEMVTPCSAVVWRQIRIASPWRSPRGCLIVRRAV